MNSKATILIICAFWLFERLIQSVFFYNLSLGVPLLIGLALSAVKFKVEPWPIFGGGIIFDVFSGLPFGVIVAAAILIYSLGFFIGGITNFFNSAPLFLFLAGIFSWLSWIIIIWLSGVPFDFSFSLPIAASIETIAVVFAINYSNEKFRFKQI